MSRTVRCCLAVLAMSLLLSGWMPNVQAADIVVKDGQKIAFLGDSITASGWINSTGYVKLTIAGLKANGIRTTAIPAGISGHRSDQMLERLERDAIDKKPDWMILSCGVNDVWHGVRGVPLERYKINIRAIVEKCRAAGVQVLILTATVIGEELDNDYNRKLTPYNEFLRSLAKERKCLLADINAIFQERIKAGSKNGHVLTYDGVHMNPEGDKVMAIGILRAFGLSTSQIKKARKAWMEIRSGVKQDEMRGIAAFQTASIMIREYEHEQII
jgi:lysophospholipase L1-like esterase